MKAQSRCDIAFRGILVSVIFPALADFRMERRKLGTCYRFMTGMLPYNFKYTYVSSPLRSASYEACVPFVIFGACRSK